VISSDNNFESYAVLLATFNGAEFLRSQLESILANTDGISDYIQVSDDGSMDSTRVILQTFGISPLVGPALGPSLNFEYLIKNCRDVNYVFLSDQDDVWLDAKMMKSIDLLQKATIPSLVVTSVITSKGKLIVPRVHNFPVALMRNNLQGCTFCFNKSLLDLLQSSNFSGAVMHDWWIGLFSLSHGSIISVKEPLSIYRLHSDNTIGLPTFFSRMKRFWLDLFRQNSREKITLQAIAFLPYASEKDKSNIREWLTAVQAPFLVRVLYVLTHARSFLEYYSDFTLIPHIISGSYKVAE
jgi:rhamnosyltransferase